MFERGYRFKITAQRDLASERCCEVFEVEASTNRPSGCLSHNSQLTATSRDLESLTSVVLCWREVLEDDGQAEQNEFERAPKRGRVSDTWRSKHLQRRSELGLPKVWHGWAGHVPPPLSERQQDLLQISWGGATCAPKSRWVVLRRVPKVLCTIHGREA